MLDMALALHHASGRRKCMVQRALSVTPKPPAVWGEEE